MNYKDTLCLPETRFPMRAQLPQREPGWLAAWAGADLYGQLMRRQAGRPEFHLHDGPPFANGDAHMGHALNMTLKDLVLKSRNMAGFHAPFVPGWDCHGLPIEHKVMKEAGGGGPAPGAVEIRRRCAEMARHFIGVQRGQFQRLAVFGEWEKPYITMEGSYEADVLRVFAAMVEKGMVFQALKPVSWSTGCQTALAEAEVEYAERKDLSVVARFALADGALAARLGRELPGPASLLIWTTTPWTLPANLAVAAGRAVDYAVYADPRGGCVVCAVALAAKLSGLEGVAPLAGPLKGTELEGLEYRHPFIARTGKVYLGDFVTTEAGTGLVHIAPGHGQDDYQLGRQAGLQVLSPVDDRGRLTAECAVPALEGMYVFDANPKVRDILRETGSLWSEE